MIKRIPLLLVLLFSLSLTGLAQSTDARTPHELVATYEALADAILSVDEAEENLVESILATTFGHAVAEKEKAAAR